MKLTADTITVEHIHAVREAMLSVPRRNAYHRATLSDCGGALDGDRVCREAVARAYNKMLGFEAAPAPQTTESQREMLATGLMMESRGQKPEWFAPNVPVAQALKRRGLVTVSFIGQRWWRIQLTQTGRDLARTMIPADGVTEEVPATDLGRARNGARVGARLPIAAEGQTYGIIAVLDRVEPDVRGDGIPARYNCRCTRCGSTFVAKGSDVVHQRVRLCCQPRRRA